MRTRDTLIFLATALLPLYDIPEAAHATLWGRNAAYWGSPRDVINRTLDAGLIRVADPEHPRAGYVPHWA